MAKKKEGTESRTGDPLSTGIRQMMYTTKKKDVNSAARNTKKAIPPLKQDRTPPLKRVRTTSPLKRDGNGHSSNDNYKKAYPLKQDRKPPLGDCEIIEYESSPQRKKIGQTQRTRKTPLKHYSHLQEVTPQRL